MRIEDELIDYYSTKMKAYSNAYDQMGKLLDSEFVLKQASNKGLKKIIIYGGGYLGIQLNRCLSREGIVNSIIDRTGKLKINDKNIKVFDVEWLRRNYTDEHIVITPFQYYEEIYKELLSIVPEEKIIFLAEFLRG